MLVERVMTIIIDVLCPLVVGYYLKRSGRVPFSFCNGLMLFNVWGLLTVINVFSFWLLPVDSTLFVIPALSIFFTSLGGVLGYFFFSRHFDNLLDKGAYVIGCSLANVGTLAGLAGFIVYGEMSFAYVQLYAAPQNIMFVLVFLPLAQYFRDKYDNAQSGKGFQIDWRKTLFSSRQVSVLGMFAGILLHVLDVPRPPVVTQIFAFLVHGGAWLALLPVGYQIDFSHARRYYKKVANMLVLKFIVMPVLVYGVARLLFADPELLGTFVLIAAAPAAINAVIATSLCRLNVDLTVASFILTTLAYLLIFMPIFYILVL